MLALAAAVLPLTSGCGSSPSNREVSPPPIAIIAAADDRNSSSVTYVYPSDAAVFAGTAVVSQYPAGRTVESDVVQRVATALGVEGVPEEVGGQWIVGPDAQIARMLTVFDDPERSWSYSEVYNGDTECAITGCASNEPPQYSDVPNEDEATQLAMTILEAMGAEVDGAVWEVDVNRQKARVVVTWPVDGVPSFFDHSFEFGQGGTLLSARGQLVEPNTVGVYPLVSCEAAVERLNNESDALLVDTLFVLGDDEPESGRTATVALSDCSLEQTAVEGADGSLWLIPEYTFDVEEYEGWLSVIAVDERFLEVTEGETQPDETLGS